MAERARFAQEWTPADEERFLATYRAFLATYKTVKRNKKSRKPPHDFTTAAADS
jgi:hypothetical protein